MKNRKNNLKKLIALLAIMTIVTTAILTGTFAKYTTAYSNSDKARVVTIDPANPFTTFNLFKNTYKVNGNTITTEQGDKIVARGTAGGQSFTIAQNEAVKYQASIAWTYTVTKNGVPTSDYVIPLEFKLDYKNWTSDITTLDGAIAVGNHYVEWKWDDANYVTYTEEQLKGVEVTVAVVVTFIEDFNAPAGVEYSTNSEGTVITISNYTGNEKNVVIPAPPAGMTIVISKGAFAKNENIESVVLPEGVTEIQGATKGDEFGAFDGCSNLKEVTLPSTLEKIGIWAFYGTALETINIPSSVKTIDGQAFAKCTSLTEITFESVPTFPKSQVFENCSSLKTVTFNGTVNGGIGGDSNFKGCDALELITYNIPDFQDFGTDSFKGVDHNIELRFPQITTTAYMLKAVATSASELGVEPGVTITVTLADGTVTITK